MDRMISDADLARLTLSLEGVQLVRDLLVNSEQDIDGFDLDLLAGILSEAPPEKCLLNLACIAGIICDYSEIDDGVKLSLKMIAKDVLDDYAPLYLKGLKTKQHQSFEAQIIYMQEDLEAFSELFAMAGDLSSSDTIQYLICSIISDQASAHAEYLDGEDTEIDYSEDTSNQRPSLILFSDNIVPFPGLFRKN